MEMGITAMIIGVGLILGVADCYETKHLGRLYNYCYFSYSSISTFIRLSSTITIRFAVRLRWFPVAGWEGFSTAVLPSLALCKCNGHSSSLYSS